MKLIDLNRDGGIGANSLFIQLGDLNILVDSGLHPKKVGRRLFIAYLGRPAAPDGLAAYENALLALGAPTDIQTLNAQYYTNSAIRNLINGISATAESSALYAST